MENKILLTPIDSLVDIIKEYPNSSIETLSSKINLSKELVEKWLVVLEEFKILNIKYKGFEGFVNISQSLLEHENSKEIDINKLKETFVAKSRDRNLSASKMKELWPLFLKKYNEEIEKLFWKKARSAGYADEKIPYAWKKFKEELNKL